MKIETILISGANGYLGSRLIERIHDRYRIIGLEKSNDTFRLNKFLDSIELVDLSRQSLDDIFNEEIDLIIHTATQYGRNGESPDEMILSNVLFPLSLLRNGIRKNVKCFLNLDTTLVRQTSQYALTKKQFTDWLLFYSNQIHVINLQLGHFYGPGFNSTNFISIMVNKMLQNEPGIDLSPGEQKRDFLFIDDVIDLLVQIIRDFRNFSGFQEYRVSSGKTYSIREVVELIHDLTGSRSVLNFGKIPYRPHEDMQSEADFQINKVMNWEPKVDFHEGIRRVIDSYKR
jgi:CDP-paratose synthetase